MYEYVKCDANETLEQPPARAKFGLLWHYTVSSAYLNKPISKIARSLARQVFKINKTGEDLASFNSIHSTGHQIILAWHNLKYRTMAL